jgi:hypothetical protein
VAGWNELLYRQRLVCVAIKWWKSACLSSLDFSSALGKTSHTYVLRVHGQHEKLIRMIQAFYTNATSRCQIIGHVSHPIPIKREIQRGCPLSITLYTTVLIPCLGMLDWELTGLHVVEETGKTTHFVYADDVAFILTWRLDIAKLWEFIYISTHQGPR